MARCHTRFKCAFTACCCVFEEITLVGSNLLNYFENAKACSKYTLKTRVATRLKGTSKVKMYFCLKLEAILYNEFSLKKYETSLKCLDDALLRLILNYCIVMVKFEVPQTYEFKTNIDFSKTKFLF